MVRLLLEHGDMRRKTRVLIFNVKGEDLLHLDRPNATYSGRPDRADLDARWRALGLADPGPFPSIGIWAPPRADDPTLPDVRGAMRPSIRTYGWTPLEFARQGLLRFCFTDASDMRGNLSFVVEQMQRELTRQAVPVDGFPGHLGLREHPGVRFADLDGFIDWITELLDDEEWAVSTEGRRWVGRAAGGTLMALTRRLHAARGRLHGLVRAGAHTIPRGDAARDEPLVSVVHLTPLHEFAQRFVVGTLLAQTFEAKESGQRDPIEFIVLDELNKYAPREGYSPIKETLIDIAQRGRSLGVILIGAQQQASLVAPEITQNAAVRISGRLDAAEAERPEYGWLTPAARARARLLMQGRMLVSQPSVPTSLAVELPFPPWATREGEVSPDDGAERAVGVFGRR
jgi:DNA helicase HerA-like ATPase